MTEHGKEIVDAASMSITVAALMNLVPALTALLSLVWIAIRIYETRTIQMMLRRWRR